MSPLKRLRATPPAQRTRPTPTAHRRRSHWPGTQPSESTDNKRQPPPWTPLLLDMLPPLTIDDFTQLTTTIRRVQHHLRIGSYNIYGGLLEQPVPFAPTKLQRLTWLFHELGLDFLMIQEHRIPAAREHEFWEALSHSGTLLTATGHTVRQTIGAYFSPATPEGVGGCAILCAKSWQDRHPWHQPLPNGRGQLLEICGKKQKRLLLTNIYGKAGAAQTATAFAEATAIYKQATDTLTAYLEKRQDRVLVIGGDLNAPWTLHLDKHCPLPAAPGQPGDAAVRDLLHQFAADCDVTPFPVSQTDAQTPHAFTVRASKATEPPSMTPQSCCTSDTAGARRSCPGRLDYLMSNLQHHQALIGTATLKSTTADMDSDHSMILVYLDRTALLGQCADVENRIRADQRKALRPFVSDQEDRTKLWKHLTTHHGEQHRQQAAEHDRIAKEGPLILDSDNATNDNEQTQLDHSWKEFCRWHESAGKHTNQAHYDTRPKIPGRSNQQNASYKKLQQYNNLLHLARTKNNTPSPDVHRLMRDTLPEYATNAPSSTRVHQTH